MLPLPVQFLLFLLAGWVSRHQQRMIEYLAVENAALREQLGGRRLRFPDAQRRRLARAAKPLGRRRLRDLSPIVTPDTLLRWYRELVAQKYDGSARRGAGRPRVAGKIRDLVIRMAIENPRWGYTRIQGALSNLGFTVIAAMDFFSVEVITWRGLVRHMVLFVIDLKTRRIEVAGIIACPDGLWMSPIARNLTNCDDGFLRDQHFVIHDRDPLFAKQFRATLRSSGIEPIRLPSRSPNLNAYAERFVRSIKSECLAQVIPLGERHLRSVVREYAEHYHNERNHQGLGNRLIAPCAGDLGGRGRIRCRERIGGLLRFYSRAA